uniref:Nucleoplasmin core domain-containing protein n=1 Tax=Capra hircus TaxID=9925 RepID=A0A452EU14_CAPHI
KAIGAAAVLVVLSQESGGWVGGRRGPGLVTMGCFFLGCELSGHTCSFSFKAEEDDTELLLALTMLCLTERIMCVNHDQEEIKVPVANLKLSCEPMFSLDDFQLQPPITFCLMSGSGPLQITGWHQIVTTSNDFLRKREKRKGGAELCPILPAEKQRGRL